MKRLVVLGGGESGTGAAILGKDKGFDVFLSDFGKIAQKYTDQLNAEGLDWEEGQHTEEKILNADLVVKSPGIPPTAPIVKAIVDKPDEVTVTEENEGDKLRLILNVAPDDMGKIIGKQGKIAQSIRKVMRALETGGQKISVDIED